MTVLDAMLSDLAECDVFNNARARHLRILELEIRKDIDEHPSHYLYRLEPVKLENDTVGQIRHIPAIGKQYLYKNEWYTIGGLAQMVGISVGAMYARINKVGLIKAVETKKGEKLSLGV